MNNEQFRELWLDGALVSVDREIDDSWRHGNNICEVFLNTKDGKYYEVAYRVSGDGEYNGIREDEFSLREVNKYVRTITKTYYR